MKKLFLFLLALVILGALTMYYTRIEHSPIADLSEAPMSFFITSVNPGNGGDFGGLAGADAYCQSLADASGSINQTWQAYLSATATEGAPAINARDRIGAGPWHNFNGELIARNVEELHIDNTISKATALSETGEVISGRGDEKNRHDILTGSNPDGTLAVAESDTTCANWTSADEGSAIVGHHDRMGLDESDSAKSWNSSHGSRGCSLENLNGTGGDGLIYCFAI